jgi:hypothetical protein
VRLAGDLAHAFCGLVLGEGEVGCSDLDEVPGRSQATERDQGSVRVDRAIVTGPPGG